MARRRRIGTRLQHLSISAMLSLAGTGCQTNAVGGAHGQGHGGANGEGSSRRGDDARALNAANSKTEEESGQLAPLVGHPWIQDLSDDKRFQDVVTLPLGATERRPIVVAVHGAGDRPNWACGGWRIGVESYAFVVCPTGTPMTSQTFGWSDTHSIESAINRALLALPRTLSSYISDAPMVYAGFSQGATLAGPFLVANASRFPVAVLAEGGYNYLADARFAHDYRAAGGQRVMVVCGTPSCFVTANRAKVVLESAGLIALVGGDGLSGHNLNVRMQGSLRREWYGLVEGLAGWETFEAHRWSAP